MNTLNLLQTLKTNHQQTILIHIKQHTFQITHTNKISTIIKNQNKLINHNLHFQPFNQITQRNNKQ